MKRAPKSVFRILGPEKARKPHDFSGFSGVYPQNLPTNSVEEAELVAEVHRAWEGYRLNTREETFQRRAQGENQN